MAAGATIIRDLVAGTAAMRKADKLYLPKSEAESNESYAARKARSVLFNATGKTIEDMTGKVFAKPVTLEKDVPQVLRDYAENIDFAGRHLNVFAKDVFFDSLQAGVGYIYVDMPPKVERPDGKPATMADEAAAGIRPYLTFVPLEQLIGWKSAIVAGVETLTQVRIKECVTEDDGEFGEKEIEQIRVVEPGRWSTYRKDTNGKDWVVYETGTIQTTKGAPLSGIPIVPVYVNRSGFMQGKPPFAKLAELNVAHWQSSSDQRNILHVARVPILYGAGFQKDETIEIGASKMVQSSSSEAKLIYVEHSGAAINAGRDDLKDLEFQMQAMGLQLLIPTPGGKTATGEIRDDAKINSPLAMMARGLQDALEQAFVFMAEFAGETFARNPDGGSIVVNTDFGVQSGNAADAQMLLDAVNAGQLDKETFWHEWQRRGILSDSFDPEVAAARIAEVRSLTRGRGADVVLHMANTPASFVEGIEMLKRVS